MSDISDLHGVIPTSLRWNAEGGVLGRSVFDEATGERAIDVIELGSNAAKFAMDIFCRERGYGRIRAGLYDMRLTPVGSNAPDWPGDDEFRPAVGCWLWNPSFGELRLETNQTTFLHAITGTWDHCRSFEEASAGKVPVIHFESRREQHYPTLGKSFWAPVIRSVGWYERDKIPPFALREPTVKSPPAFDGQVPFALLEGHEALRETPLQKNLAEKLAGKTAGKRGKPAKPSTIGDFIDDEIPEL